MGRRSSLQGGKHSCAGATGNDYSAMISASIRRRFLLVAEPPYLGYAGVDRFPLSLYSLLEKRKLALDSFLQGLSAAERSDAETHLQGSDLN